MASENLTFDVLARDRASATFNKIGQSTAALETRFARLTRAATGIATTLVGAQIGKSVLDAADKFELSRSRLETITKNIGVNFDGLSKQVGSADDRMAKFGFTSADTEGSLASLESVTRDPIKAFKDLALAADIARGRNIGLSEATLILQRVETGHIAQLAKLGIATKDAAGHTLTQAQTLRMLTDLYGGAASRFADTFAGKQAAVAAEMKNSAAQIGVALLPAAVDLAKVLQQDVLPPIESLAKFLDRNRKTIEPLAKAILIAAAAWKVYTLGAKAAEAISAGVGRQAVITAAQLTATQRGMPDLRSKAGVAAAEVPLLGLRGRALGALPYAAGFGATVGGSFLGGNAGSALTGAGTGAMLGSAIPGIGTLIGALTGAAISQLGKTGTHANQDQFNVLAGTPEGAKQLQDLIKTASKAGSFGVGKELRQMAQAALDAANKEKVLGSAVVSTTDKIQRQADEIIKAGRISLDLKATQDGLRAAMHAAAQTAIDNGKALAGNSDAALANRDALRNQVGQIFSVIDAMKAHGAGAQAQASMLDILTQAVEQNAIKLYGDKNAIDSFLTSLGLIPGQAANALTAVAALDAAMAERTGLPGRDVKAGAVGRAGEAAAVAAAKASAKKIGDSFTSGYTPVVSKAAEKAAKAVSDSMQKARDKVVNDLQTIRSAIDSTTASVAGFADFSASGTDALGASGLNTDVGGQLKAKASRLEQFARLFNQLDHAGLDAHLMAQFAQIGPDAIPAMQSLMHSGKRGIGQVNRIEQRIQTAAGRVAVTSVGEQNAGLIHKDLTTTLPAKLERGFGRALRNLHVSVSLRETDRKNGIAVVMAP
jgi:hypothetical protein